MVKALTERAPTARNVRMTLRNMMIGIVAGGGTDNSGARPEDLEVGGGTGVGCAAAEETGRYSSTLL